jgi:hypothetical protein
MARSVARQRRTDAVALPEWVRPQLTQLVDAAPEGDQWLHEIKYDGYRMHARLDRGAVKLLTRTGLDWTDKYPAIANAVAALDARQAYLDGELCGIGPDGIPSFNIVQLASDRGNAASLQRVREGIRVFHAFDVAATPRVAIPIPGAANAATGLEATHFEAEFAQAIDRVETADSGADDDRIKSCGLWGACRQLGSPAMLEVMKVRRRSL